MGLDAIHDWNCQHLDKGQWKNAVIVFQCVSLCSSGRQIVTSTYVRMQLYLCFRWLTLEGHYQQIFGHIREILCDSNHFTFPELSRWSVRHRELNTIKVLLRAPGGGIGKRREKTTFGRALFRVVHCVDGLKVEN